MLNGAKGGNFTWPNQTSYRIICFDNQSLQNILHTSCPTKRSPFWGPGGKIEPKHLLESLIWLY